MIISAAVLAVLFYSGLVKIKPAHPFDCLLEPQVIHTVNGSLSCNPVKNNRGNYYSSRLKVSSVKGKVSSYEITSSARGIVDVMLPVSYVESLYPGKLYSSAGRGVLAESGQCLSLRGKFSLKKNCFYAEEVFYLGSGSGFRAFCMNIRAKVRLAFKRLMYSWGNAGGLVLSLLSGSREYLEDGVSSLFMLAGLSHILALSGMHLSFFAGIADFSGRKLFGKKYSFYARLAGILFFVFFAGLSPSLLRALICSLIMLAASALYCQDTDYLAVLSAAFMIHICVAAEDMYTPAFLLSYCALSGILIFSPEIKRILIPWTGDKISSSLSASIGAQLASFPLSLSMFSMVAPGGILASVIVSPLASFFILAALVSVILSLFIPFLSPLFGIIMNLLYEVIIFTVRLFTFIPCIKL
ncbi:ComEC/Rec2 family competence protein [Treponema sp.]|uniref:ComEC/Rec2 family competence protein n=1 Tax=Treponema sp. TaxID=166 RepID=UPI0025F2C8AA|nr:ComEC/Rec2 family competence protein [Treponema sp.]MCR5218433.1 ComEC/Rec2 family competence protein [Treponema sp.]